MKLRIKEWSRLGGSPGDHAGFPAAACPDQVQTRVCLSKASP